MPGSYFLQNAALPSYASEFRSQELLQNLKIFKPNIFYYYLLYFKSFYFFQLGASTDAGINILFEPKSGGKHRLTVMLNGKNYTGTPVDVEVQGL